MDGAAGPSNLDAVAWKQLLTSFKSASTELCDTIASVAGRLSTSFVDPSRLSAFVACRLITLDKCPVLRPIGIEETVRRIIGKAIAITITEDIQEACDALQVCAGHISGCKVAVHACAKFMIPNKHKQFYLSMPQIPLTHLIVRQLFATFSKYTPFSKIIINTYRENSKLFIDDHTLLPGRYHSR